MNISPNINIFSVQKIIGIIWINYIVLYIENNEYNFKLEASGSHI